MIDDGRWWRHVEPAATENCRHASVAFADPLHGWAVGFAGTIVATADGGVTWTVQRSGTTERLHAATFSDSTHGWAAGED